MAWSLPKKARIVFSWGVDSYTDYCTSTDKELRYVFLGDGLSSSQMICYDPGYPFLIPYNTQSYGIFSYTAGVNNFKNWSAQTTTSFTGVGTRTLTLLNNYEEDTCSGGLTYRSYFTTPRLNATFLSDNGSTCVVRISDAGDLLLPTNSVKNLYIYSSGTWNYLASSSIIPAGVQAQSYYPVSIDLTFDTSYSATPIEFKVLYSGESATYSATTNMFIELLYVPEVTCGESTYCLSNTGNAYDDTYYSAGTINSHNYFTGSTNGYYIYYSTGTTSWCLSSSLNGSCLLVGKTPCKSDCPDLCEEYFTTGICPTPTPTPTINCNSFDFTSVFDCYVAETPTPTPTPTATITPTITPTSSPISVIASIIGVTSTPTPTPTPTPSTYIVEKCLVTGTSTYNTFESNIECPLSYVFEECTGGTVYSTMNSVGFTGSTSVGTVFSAVINGITKCVTYKGTSQSISGIDTITVTYPSFTDCTDCLNT